MNTPEHQYAGKLLHDRIIGAVELCCRRGEMLLIQNKRVNWDTCQIGIPGATAKDKENQAQLRRIDLRWHDLRHEGACRLLADGVDGN